MCIIFIDKEKFKLCMHECTMHVIVKQEVKWAFPALYNLFTGTLILMKDYAYTRLIFIKLGK